MLIVKPNVGQGALTAIAGRVKGRRVARLEPGVNVERRGSEGAQRRRDRRAERHVQVAGAEALHLELVAGHARELQAAGEGDALALAIDVDRVEDRVEVRPVSASSPRASRGSPATMSLPQPRNIPPTSIPG